MSKQIIEAVKSAEAAAERKKSIAAEKARAHTAAAKETAKKAYEDAVASAKQDMREKLAVIGEQSDAIVRKNRAEAEDEAARETEAARSNMDAAVEIIIGELIRNVGK